MSAPKTGPTFRSGVPETCRSNAELNSLAPDPFRQAVPLAVRAAVTGHPIRSSSVERPLGKSKQKTARFSSWK